MSDHYYALTVILEHDIKDDYAQPLIDAIKQLRGVADVQPLLATPDVYFGQFTARNDLIKQLWDVLRPKDREEK